MIVVQFFPTHRNKWIDSAVKFDGYMPAIRYAEVLQDAMMIKTRVVVRTESQVWP